MDDYYEFQRRSAYRLALEGESRREREADAAARPQPQIQQRSFEGLVYKTRDNAAQPYETQQQDEWAGWNNRCDAKICAALSEFAVEIAKALDNVVDGTNLATDNLAKAIVSEREKTAKLAELLDREREKAVKLRGEVEVLRVMVRSQNIGVNVRGRKNVA